MNAKHVFLVVLGAVFLVSCKNETKQVTVPVEKNIFRVTLNLLIKKNDTLHLYYTEDNSINFTEENSIWTAVPGKDDAQDLVFELPEDLYPTQFRIDFGVNKQNEKIIFKGFKLDYLNKSFSSNENTVYNYFRINTDNTTIDENTKELSRLDPNIAAGPCLYPLEIPLKTEIDKLAK